ncbi:MAG TPA: TIM barrel protein [Steroidobacteraceae bacterium]|nr:TIM barrel protein [Steroidobacteraceae bacterium]
MERRTFLIGTGSVALSVTMASARVGAATPPRDRVGLGTVSLRNRFEQTKPKGTVLEHPLTLIEVPAYYRDRFEVHQLEFWSNHFESLGRPYLKELRKRIKAAGAKLINIQLDADYDLASTDETRRQQSLAIAHQWIDAAALVGSAAIRINPGRPNGSVEQSIASMKEVNRHCLARRLPLLTENHFGLEMNPDIHLRIRAEAGPKNIYTLPDLGNYPVASMWDSLAKILPYAWVVSAKAVDFDAQGNHLSYDYDRCLQLCEDAGFKGIYLVEQWSRKEQPIDAEKIADWMLERTRAFLRAKQVS